MKYFRGASALSVAYLKETMRSKTALFWNIVFPLFFLIVFAIIFGGGNPKNVTYILPGVLTITVISASFFGVSFSMVMQRETGVYRRFKATPINALSVVIAHAVTALVNLLLGLILQLSVAMIFFKTTLSGTLSSLTVVILLAAFAFIPLGLIIGSVARDTKTAPAITNVLFFPMMFLSGAAVPFFMLPGWVRDIAGFLPATYIVEMLQGVIVRGEAVSALMTPAIILAVTGAVGFSLNGLLFRWESTEPLRKDRLAIAVGALAVVYLVAFLIGPKLKMATPPY